MITTERFTRYMTDQVHPHVNAVSVELAEIEDLLCGFDDYIFQSLREELEKHARAARAILNELSDVVYDTFGFMSEREPVYLRVPGGVFASSVESTEAAN